MLERCLRGLADTCVCTCWVEQGSVDHFLLLVGMEVRVKSAYMTVDDEGIAEDVFHITTLSGNKLSDARVRDIVERVRSFVMFCQPSGRKVPVEWRNGPVLVSNKADGDMTLMTVVEARKRAGVPAPHDRADAAVVLHGCAAVCTFDP